MKELEMSSVELECVAGGNCDYVCHGNCANWCGALATAGDGIIDFRQCVMDCGRGCGCI